MKNLSINQVAVLSALTLHALLLVVSVSPGPLPLERSQKISVRLLPATETSGLTPVPAITEPVKPRPVIEKESQKQIPASAPVTETPPPKPLVRPEPAPLKTPEPVAADIPASEPAPVASPVAAAAPALPVELPTETPRPAARAATASRLGDYLTTVREAVELNKDYPAFARQLGQQGTTVVRVQIDPEGRLLRAAILSSSGHKSLDKAALAAVRNAGRFRSPAEFGLTEVTVDIPIAYKLI